MFISHTPSPPDRSIPCNLSSPALTCVFSSFHSTFLTNFILLHLTPASIDQNGLSTSNSSSLNTDILSFASTSITKVLRSSNSQRPFQHTHALNIRCNSNHYNTNSPRRLPPLPLFQPQNPFPINTHLAPIRRLLHHPRHPHLRPHIPPNPIQPHPPFNHALPRPHATQARRQVQPSQMGTLAASRAILQTPWTQSGDV